MIEVMCNDCRRAFPSEETIGFTESVISGGSNSTRVYRGTRGGVGFGGSSSQRFRNVERNLCLPCAEARIEAARRAKRGRLIGLAIIIGIVIGAYELTPTIKAPAGPPAIEADNTTSNAVDAGDANAAADAPQNLSSPVDAAPAAPPIADQPEEPSPPPAERMLPVEQPRAPPPARAASYPPIDNAIHEALSTGSTASWHSGRWHGYVVVSAAQPYADETCRTISVTTISGSDQSETPARMWCLPAAGGVWAPR